MFLGGVRDLPVVLVPALAAALDPSPDGKAYRYMGTRELYRAAGFEEVAGPPEGRPVMRRPI